MRIYEGLVVYRSLKTSDGARKFSDAAIALRIGHESGGKLIVTTYGQILPYELTWLPTKKGNPPAWSHFAPKPKPAPLLYIRTPRPVQIELFHLIAIQAEFAL